MGRYKYIPRGTAGGWIKSQDSPVIGGALGTVFDCCVRKENEGYRMWYSWRPVTCIVYAESTDGRNWTLPKVVLTYDEESEWECSEVSITSSILFIPIYLD